MELVLSNARVNFHAVAVRDVGRFPETVISAEFYRINFYDDDGDGDGNVVTVFLPSLVAAELADKLTPKPAPAPGMVTFKNILCDHCGAEFDGWYPVGQQPKPGQFWCQKCEVVDNG